MRVGRSGQNHIWRLFNGQFGAQFKIDECDLGIGLADVDDCDEARRVHGMWKTVSSGVAMGSLSGLTAMMSAMCAHQRFMTGWSGSFAMP